jgi:leucyl aminopeptidase
LDGLISPITLCANHPLPVTFKLNLNIYVRKIKMAEPATKRRRSPNDEPSLRMERTMQPKAGIVLCAKSEYSANVADAVVIGLFDTGTPIQRERLSMVEEIVQDSLLSVSRDFDNTSRKATNAGVITPPVRLRSQRFAILGLGTHSENRTFANDAELGLKVGSSIGTYLGQEMGCKAAKIYLPQNLLLSRHFVKEMIQSFLHELYSDNRFRTRDNIRHLAKDLSQIYIYPLPNVTDDDSMLYPSLNDEINASLKFNEYAQEGRAIAFGQYFAMDIVNAPHNVLNAVSLANEARELGLSDGLSCTILDKEACESRGMGAFLGVARGSEVEPQLIHLVYRSKGDIHHKIGLVGKGVMFDTGGYNIKTSTMELMKFDCGGAAAVLGAARSIARIQPKGVEVHFVIAACENMIGPKAYVPSDVLIASNGKTIEVVNTDAEGRLTLADALVYVDQEVGCECVVELSTLTASCMVALGKKICGIWTTNDKLATELESAAKATGEQSWRMPMAYEYSDQLTSAIADLKNCGSQFGGAITAALFLQNFVRSEKAFAHIDMAGPVWDEKKGATGFGVKLITEWITNLVN